MDVKLFTYQGLVVTIIHDLIILGAFSGWMWFQVQVMGNDLKVGGSTPAYSRSK